MARSEVREDVEDAANQSHNAEVAVRLPVDWESVSRFKQPEDSLCYCYGRPRMDGCGSSIVNCSRWG
jgi:hypothetical protein